jgi:hypothetical protein
MRDTGQLRPNRSCAAPMSITASGRHRPPPCPPPARLAAQALCTCSGGAWRSVAQRACAAGFRNTVPGVNRPAIGRRPAGRRHQRRRHLATTRASTPTTRSGLRGPLARDHAMVPAPAPGWPAATCGCAPPGRTPPRQKPPVAGAQLQVGLAIDGAHGAGKLVQRRRIDQVHRKRQRHPQHHRHHRSRIAPRVVAQLLPGEGAH